LENKKKIDKLGYVCYSNTGKERTFSLYSEQPDKQMKKLFIHSVLLVIAFIPAEAYLGIWYFLGPADFWQRLVMVLVGIILFLPAQIIFLMLGGMAWDHLS